MGLRLMQLSDHQQLADLWRAEGMPDDEEYFQTVLNHNPQTCWVIEENGQIIAAACGLFNGRHGILASVVVHPDERGKGYGKQVVTACIESLQAQGSKRIRLFVYKENLKARQIYEHLGFEIMDDSHYMGLKT